MKTTKTKTYGVQQKQCSEENLFLLMAKKKKKKKKKKGLNTMIYFYTLGIRERRAR